MDEKTVLAIKKEIALRFELGLTLSEDKTVLTNLDKKIRLLASGLKIT